MKDPKDSFSSDEILESYRSLNEINWRGNKNQQEDEDGDTEDECIDDYREDNYK